MHSYFNLHKYDWLQIDNEHPQNGSGKLENRGNCLVYEWVAFSRKIGICIMGLISNSQNPNGTSLPKPNLSTPWGHSHMSVDIKCLSIDPLFYADHTPNDPLSLFSPHPVTPFFPLLYQILHTNCKFLHFAFWEI